MRFLLPIVGIAILIVFLAIGLRLNPHEVPSPLIGKPAPDFELPRLDGQGSVRAAELRGQPLLVNFWASWCRPCLEEHPLMMKLAARADVRIAGINYKDEADDARHWLSRHGNPYDLVAQDRKGAAGLDWGVYGVPETFVIDAAGTIVYKHVGPLTAEAWTRHVAPLLGVAP